MSRQKRYSLYPIISFLTLLTAVSVVTQVLAQPYWASLPPYNLLWPLWSPPLSPIDQVTKAPTPLISWLDKNTVLPIQPGLCWDPIAFPKGPVWLLYNTPPAFGGGLLYWTQLYGLNPFPPDYLTTPSGFPIPLELPPDFTAYLPTKTKHFASWVQVANLLYALTYGAPIAGLLTPADIWGLSLL